MNSNPHLWRRVFWHRVRACCGHVFDVVVFLLVATCLAWLTYFGFVAP